MASPPSRGSGFAGACNGVGTGWDGFDMFRFERLKPALEACSAQGLVCMGAGETLDAKSASRVLSASLGSGTSFLYHSVTLDIDSKKADNGSTAVNLKK